MRAPNGLLTFILGVPNKKVNIIRFAKLGKHKKRKVCYLARGGGYLKSRLFRDFTILPKTIGGLGELDGIGNGWYR